MRRLCDLKSGDIWTSEINQICKKRIKSMFRGMILSEGREAKRMLKEESMDEWSRERIKTNYTTLVGKINETYETLCDRLYLSYEFLPERRID